MSFRECSREESLTMAEVILPPLLEVKCFFEKLDAKSINQLDSIH